MNKDTWIHTVTNAEYGTTGALGSPRAWLRRALDSTGLDDTTFQPGSLTPTEISVAGIWYKKPEGYNIPITGQHRELFRWFDIPVPEQMMRPRSRVPLIPAIGVCAAVPMHEVLHWLRVYQEHGAVYTWWNTPVDRSMRAVGEGMRVRRKLNHHVVYEMLDAGMTSAEIAQKLHFPGPNIDYVARKWRNKEQLKPHKPHLNKVAVLEACRAGVPVKDVAIQYDTTPAYIYKLIENTK